MSCRQDRQAGLTLIECLACVVILGTAVIAGLSLVQVQAQVVSSDELRIIASRLLQRELEQIDTCHYTSLADSPPALSRTDARFTLERQVNESSSMYKEVRILVSWIADSGVRQVESVTALRCANTLER